MEFGLTAEQKDIQKAAREFAEGEFDRDLAIELDRTETYPREIVRKGAELGFVGIHYPDGLCGIRFLVTPHVLVTEQFCRKDSGIGVCFEMSAFGNEMIVHHGSKELQRKWVPRITSGECMSAGGFPEPNHGSDILRLDTTALRDGDEYVINGTKTFISNGDLCDYLLLLCMTDPDAEPSYRGMSTILVESDRPGYVAESVGRKMGNHMASTCEIALTDVRVPVSNRIGEEGRGFYNVLGFFNETRAHAAAQALGLAQGAFDRAVSYIKKREQFGQRIADFQVSQHKIADMATKIETARLLVYKAAWNLDRGKQDPALSSMAKNVATRCAIEVADEAIQLMGGYGYLIENEVERFYRDARIMEIWEGTKEIQKNIIAQQLLGRG